MSTHSLGNMKKRKRWLAGAEHRIPYGLLAASSPPSQSLHCLLELSCSTSYRTHITYQCFFLLNPNAQWGHNATANEDKSARGWLGYLRRAGRRGWASYAALLLSVLARRSRGGDKTTRRPRFLLCARHPWFWAGRRWATERTWHFPRDGFTFGWL